MNGRLVEQLAVGLLGRRDNARHGVTGHEVAFASMASPTWFTPWVDTRVTERDSQHDDVEASGSVDLYWIPLGAGTPVVRLSGELFETCGTRTR